jgi:predicted glycosyltransferase
MKIIVDLCHPAQVNFFKNALNELKQNEHQIILTVLNRGKLPLIAENEFKNYNIHVINNHRGTKFSIIVEANILKFFTLLWICLKHKPQIGISAGSFTLGAVLKIFGKPNIQFDDDPERKLNVLLEKITSTKLFFPLFLKEQTNKVFKYNSLKEWAYLSPAYFKPTISVLNQYGLLVGEYIFVREVSVGSLNYINQKNNLIASISERFPKHTKVILSLENKKTKNQYPDNWIMLEEPVSDIHSLIYFSKLLVSSGDSMAREGALLGVPSIYCGIREMAANDVLINKNMLHFVNIENLEEIIIKIFSKKYKNEDQNSFRNTLYKEWDDVNKLIVSEIEKFKK